MSDELKKMFQGWIKEAEEHVERLKRWKKSGGTLESYPDGKTIDCFIAREEVRIKNLQQAIEHL